MDRRPFCCVRNKKKRPIRSAFEGPGPWGQMEPESTVNAQARREFRTGSKRLRLMPSGQITDGNASQVDH
jgi:hypothetical protein